MTQLKLPASLAATMASVRSVLPSAFLAGGALRDLDNGRPVKDYDVFFTEQFNVADMLHALRGSYAYARQCPGAYMDGAADEVSGTYTFISLLSDLPELNFIQLAPTFTPAAIVERVDFGICQIGADANGITTTPAYDHDKANECFTLTRAETVEGVMRSLKRYERLKQKYVGWSLEWHTTHNDLVMQAMDALEVEAGLIVTNNGMSTIAETF